MAADQNETQYSAWVRRGADLLGEVHDLAVQAAASLVFDIKGRGWPHVYAASLYGTLIEVSGSCIALARGRALVGIAILSRTCWEAFVDLKNVLNDPEYAEHLELKRYKEWLRILDEAQGGKNAYVAGIAQDPAFAEHRKEYELGLERAQKQGGRELSVRERFERAGHPQEYMSLYNFLAAEAHNNGRALIRRHLDTDKDPPELMLYDEEPGFVIPSLSTLSEMLLKVTRRMHEAFGKEALQLGDLPDRLRAFDEELLAGGQ